MSNPEEMANIPWRTDTLEDNDYNSAALGEIRLEMFRLKQTNKSQQHTGIGADRPDAQPTLVKPTLKDPAAWRTLYTKYAKSCIATL